MNKTTTLILYLLLFFCVGVQKNYAQEKKDFQLRVLSYNVHHCSPPSKTVDFIDIPAIVKVIKDINPDIVALQEIDVNTERSGKGHQAKELARLTGMPYSYFVKTIDYQGGDYGIAILSKYPFVDSLQYALPMVYGEGGEDRGIAGVAIEPVKGERIAFACTHLDLKEANRKVQIDAITDYIDNTHIGMPVIIAGDFNSTPDSYVVKELDKVFKRTCVKADCPHTIPQINPSRTIDYIAFTPKDVFEVVEHRVINEPYASDHLPVFAILKKKEKVQPFELSEKEKKEGYKILFDGTNMDQWTGNTVDYILEDGCISMHPSSKHGGNLYTRDEFGDFIFRFEFQLTEGANNGLGIRTPMEGDAAYVGVELQILDNESPKFKNLKPYQFHGSVYGIIPAKRGYLKPIGEWNYQEVVAKGDNIKITLNGTVILDGNIKKATKNGTPDGKEHPGLFNKKGHIGFLGHGSPVKFKNIRIKQL